MLLLMELIEARMTKALPVAAGVKSSFSVKVQQQQQLIVFAVALN
jgi:hypothetical protein